MMSGTQACFLGTTSDAQFCFSRREENIELVKKTSNKQKQEKVDPERRENVGTDSTRRGRMTPLPPARMSR